MRIVSLEKKTRKKNKNACIDLLLLSKIVVLCSLCFLPTERKRHIGYEIIQEKRSRKSREDDPIALSDWIESDAGVLFKTIVAMNPHACTQCVILGFSHD
jgi:hypothetical protein